MSNKFVLVSGLLSFLLAGACLLNTPKEDIVVKAVDEWEETRKTNELAIKYGQTVSSDPNADYTVAENGKYAFGIRHGDLSKNIISKFDKVTSASNSATFVMASDETNKEYANVLHWAMYSSNGDGYSFFFKALDNISFSAVTGDYGGYTVGAYIRYYFKDQNSNCFVPLSSKKLTSDDKNAPFDTINLFAGDEIYWEFISYGTTTGSNRLNIQRNSATDFYPSFILGSPSDSVEYVYGQQTSYETYFTESLENIKNGGAASTSNGYLDISFKHGYPHSIQSMEQYNNSAIFTDSSRDLARFSINQVQMNVGDDAILMFTAKEGVVIDLNWSTDDSNGIASTVGDCSIRFYALSSSGDLYLLDEKAVEANNKGTNGEYDISVTLRASESLLVSIGSNDDSLNVLNYTPTISATIKNYVIGNTIDFDSIDELATYKTTKINGLHWYFSSASGAYDINASNVLIEHFTYCVDVEVKYQRKIKNASSKAEVDTFVNQYRTEVKNTSDAAKFVKSYLYMREYDIYWNDTAGSDLCKTYYGPAKEAFNNLSFGAREIFCENIRFSAAYERLSSWAKANNDHIDDEYLIKANNSSLLNTFSENKNATILIAVVIVASILSVGVLVISKTVTRRAK